jgi:hypothetical protein
VVAVSMFRKLASMPLSCCTRASFVSDALQVRTGEQ